MADVWLDLLARGNHSGTQSLSTITDAGDAASKNTGVSVGTLVVLEDVNGTPGLPAIDGSRLTGIAGGPSAVKSVFTRSGDVVAEAADYSASQVANDSGTDGLFVSNALDILEHFKSTVFAQVDDPAALSVVGDVWIEI